MLEDLGYSLSWGVRPVLFSIGQHPVSSYSFFVLVALLAAVLIYYLEARKIGELGDHSFNIFMAALLGGLLGAKIPIWIMNWRLIVASFPDITPLLSGRTIVGGLIGGTAAVILVRHFLKIEKKLGNIFVPAIGLAIFFGRIGCFLRGCCYGVATNLPWGVDFGDGIHRHPTQLYEALFGLLVFVFTIGLKKDKIKAGLLFQIFIVSYFIVRFLVEFLRQEPRIYFGLTLAQIVSIVVILYNLFILLKGGKNERILQADRSK